MIRFRIPMLIPAAALLSACGPGPLIGPAGRDALLLLGLIAAALFLWRHFRREGSGPREALRLLEARYARGEIERDEYLRRRADLNSVGGRFPGGPRNSLLRIRRISVESSHAPRRVHCV